MLEIEPGLLDKDWFLLCTPKHTYDLRKGLAGIRDHNPNDFITKMTAYSPSDKGMDIWLDALNTFFCGDKALIQYVQRVAGIVCEVSAAPEDPADSKEITEDTEPIRVAQMDLTIPIENWTVAQMTNLVRMLYSKQYLINRMLDYGMLSIEESFITAISENPPETAADFEERILKAIEGDCICGFRIADGKAALSVPFAEDEPTRWTAYADLLKGILKTAETASRISIKRLDDSENEKYHANSWLMRMGFGGADYKETRRILMGHLTGFAAFKSAADMEAHKKRQAQRRRERREEGQHEQPEA